MDKYILSRKNQDDIDEIFAYGKVIFGKGKAVDCLIGLRFCFAFLMENPQIGRNRNDIK